MAAAHRLAILIMVLQRVRSTRCTGFCARKVQQALRACCSVRIVGCHNENGCAPSAPLAFALSDATALNACKPVKRGCAAPVIGSSKETVRQNPMSVKKQ